MSDVAKTYQELKEEYKNTGAKTYQELEEEYKNKHPGVDLNKKERASLELLKQNQRIEMNKNYARKKKKMWNSVNK